MRPNLTIGAIALSLLCGPVFADGNSFTVYSITNKSETVKGKFFLDGFSPNQILKFIAKDCKGKVGQMALVGKPRKKRGKLYQKYQTTCSGGLAANYHGSFATIEVEKMADGRILVEATTTDANGNIVRLTSYRK